MNTPKMLAVACAALVLPLAACSDDNDDVDDIVDVTSVDPGSLDIDTGTSDITTAPGGVGDSLPATTMGGDTGASTTDMGSGTTVAP